MSENAPISPTTSVTAGNIPTAQNSPVKEEPLSDFDNQLKALQENPLQPQLWRRVIELAETGGKTDEINRAYESLLKAYPNVAAVQIAYINHFLSDPRTFGKAEELFRQFLRNSPSVELCRSYMTYVRRVNSDPASREAVKQSYEFALNLVGQDKDSADLWSDFIHFLEAGETTSTWEAQQKQDALRKVYHRAVQIPLENLTTLWEATERFEMERNKITAKKFMQDLSPAHIQARQTLRELKGHLAGLNLIPVSSTPGQLHLHLPVVPTWTSAERALVVKWKTYLKFEEDNPLMLLEEKDKPTYISRVTGVYRKAVIRMRFFPEIWFLAYCWLNSDNVNKHDEAMNMLRAGIEANPGSFLLNFTYAESLESKITYSESVDGKKNFDPVHEVYRKFLSFTSDALIKLERELAERTQNTSLEQTQSQDTVDSQGSQEDERPNRNPELTERKREYGLAYIMYMRFGRRAEGEKASRSIFAKARKDRWAPWEVYEAAALMEYHTSEDKMVPVRIFEKGMETYGEDVHYVDKYLEYLISVNDESNARALFERVIGKFTPDKARPIWQRWAKYEYQYGNLEAALKLEKRMGEVYPKDRPIKRFAQRHMYLDIDAIASRDLGYNNISKSSGSINGPNPPKEKEPTIPGFLPSSHHGSGSSNHASGSGLKRERASSPANKDRDYKRQRDRWGSPRRRHSPDRDGGRSGWDRERDVTMGRDVRDPRDTGRDSGPRRRRDEVPPVISQFIGSLPKAAAFDGPVFRTDDLMTLLRNAVIPNSRARSPPPRVGGGGRPPPDYGPYQGPGSGQHPQHSRRRY